MTDCTPTPEQVEAAAQALFEESQELDQDNAWDDPLPDEWRSAWREAARAALEAAKLAAPAAPVDEGKIAEALAKHTPAAAGPSTVACKCDRTWRSLAQFTEHQAQAVVEALVGKQ